MVGLSYVAVIYLSLVTGRAMAPADSRKPITAEARVWSHTSQCAFCFKFSHSVVFSYN
jgi:hypothetical protein